MQCMNEGCQSMHYAKVGKSELSAKFPNPELGRGHLVVSCGMRHVGERVCVWRKNVKRKEGRKCVH